MRAIMIAVAVLVASIALGSIALDEGEVVQLVTVDAHHREHETPVWIVEVGGTTWIRSLSGRSDWLARLRARPEVTLLRGTQRDRRLGIVSDDPETCRRVDAAMLEKYGLADRIFLLVASLGGGEPLPVQLHREAGSVTPPAS